MNKPAQTYGLRFRVENDRDYGHIKGWIVTLDDTKPEGCTYPDRYDCQMHDFSITSQASRGDNKLYGWTLFCDISRVDLHSAQRAVKVLAPIERKLERMYDEEGNAQTFGIWVNRVCRAIGAKRVFLALDRETVSRTGDTWRSMSIGDAVSALDREADLLVSKLNPQAIAA